MQIKKNQIWMHEETKAKYKVIQIEREYDSTILNIKIQNINNLGVILDLGDWELENLYEKIRD